MLTGERRPAGRRGMTVLGKIPAVPKPINLPSQRLENGGLDPNVEIVPKGSVSWGTTGRSPPTISSPWGTSAQSSSPPVGGGPWLTGPPRPSTAGGHSGSAAVGGGLSGPTSSGGAWGNAPRPSSAGSGIRPSSAGSLRQTQDAAPVANAWGTATARPSSASGVLGDAHSQTPGTRPRSAETRTSSSQPPGPLTRFADQSNGPAVPPPPAWGGAGAARKLGEEPHQPARFTLTRGDFPTLGSEKNPDLRPQQNKISSTSERPTSEDERASLTEERPPLAPAALYGGETPPTSGAAYGGQERMPEAWRKESRPYGGPPGMAGDGPPPPIPGPFGQPPLADTWRREPGHGAAGAGGGPSDDNWRSRGGPPVGPYGPPGPGRFQGPDPAAFMHQQRYGPGPGPGGPYGRGGGPGPGGYSRYGDMFGNAPTFGRTGGGGAPPRPGPPPPMGPGGLYQGPYDNFYGPPPGPGGYGNTDEREMMLGMNGPHGMYGNFSQGPVEGFNRYPPMGPGPGLRHMPNNSGMNRDRSDSVGFEGYREGTRHKEIAPSFRDGGAGIGRGSKDGFTRESKEGPSQEGKEGVRMASFQDSGDSRRGAGGHVNNASSMDGEGQRPSSRGGHLGSHRDWGAAASNDEPMDFSKPVFEEDISSASPTPTGKKAPSAGDTDALQQTKIDGKGKEYVKLEEPTAEDVDLAAGVHAAKVSGERGELEEAAGVLHAPKSSGANKDDYSERRKQKEVETSGAAVSKTRAAEESSVPEIKDPVARKVPVSEGNDALERRWGRDGKMSAQSSRERSFGREPMFSSHGKVSGRFAANKKDTNITSPAVSSTMRSGGQHVGGSNRYSTSGSSQGASKSSASESLITEETVVSPSVQEKQWKPQISYESNPTSPSGSDGHSGNNEKLRILKRVGENGLESPRSDAVSTTEISSAAEVLVVANMSEPTLGKDDARLRTKGVTSHDGEKEWRPKVSAVADISAGELSSASATVVAKEATPSSAMPLTSAEVTGAGDKAALDFGTPGSDNYDYEAQRAKMKEIALQRAIQLRKEEDERVKEQKAKAMAKLEELNRRSLVVPAVQPTADEPALDEAAEEAAAPALVVDSQDQEVEEVEAEAKELILGATAENAGGGTGSGASRGVRSCRNEHGKRERVGDRKSGGGGRSREEHRAKMGSGERRELMKGRLTPSSGQGKMEPPLLPQPSSQQHSATPQALLPSPASEHAVAHGSQPESSIPPAAVDTTAGLLGAQVQQQQQPHSNKPQEPRQRRQSAANSKHAARQQQQQQQQQLEAVTDADRALQAPPQDAAGADSAADKNVAWPVGSANSNSLDHDVRDAATFYMGSTVANTEGSTTAARKKKAKSSSRNRQKSEGFSVSIDFAPAVIELSQGLNLDLSSSNESGTEAGKPVSKVAKAGVVDDSVQGVPVSAVPQKEVIPVHPKVDLALVEASSPVVEGPGAVDPAMTFRSNGDAPSKRPQRKPQQQPARRVSTRERGAVSQDVRLGDKPYGGVEGMIWAPVRSPLGAAPGGPTPKGGFGPEGIGGLSVEKKEESVAPPQQTGRARRAELERYTPKPVVKQQAQQQQQEETQQQQQQQVAPSVSQQPQGNESTNLFTTGDLTSQISSPTSPDVKFGSDVRQAEGTGKHGRGHSSWQRRQSGNERMNAAKENHHQIHASESVESGGKSQLQQQQQSVPSQGQHTHHHRNRPLASVPEQQSRPGTYQGRPDQASRHPPSTPSLGGEKEQQQQPHPKAQAQAQAQAHAHQDPLPQQQGRSGAHSNVGSRPATPAAAASATEKEPKISQEGAGPYQPRPGSSQKKRGASAENDVQQASVEPVRSHRSSNTSQMDRQHLASGKYDRDRDNHASHGSLERGGPGHSGRSSHNYRQQGSASHDRDLLRVPSGSQQKQQQPRSSVPTQPIASEGAPTSREKDHKASVSAGQARPVPASGHGQQQHANPFSAAQEREPSHGEHVGGGPPQQQQRRSPGRHRTRQQQQQHAVSHEREQTAPGQQGGHQQQQSRYRQSGHERDQRDVLNAVHHRQQQLKGGSDGHWQQTGGGVTTEQNQQQPRGELGRSHEQQSTSGPTPQKSLVIPSHANSTLVAPDAHSKAQVPSDPQRQPSQYQAGSQHQKSQQQQQQQQQQHAGPQSSRAETGPNRSHSSNGEWAGSSPPPVRKEHGHSRQRQRYGGRYTGVGSARGGDNERREQQSERAAAKQRLPIDATGGAVTSRVGS